MNIYAALNSINSEISCISKSRKNTVQNFSFRGIDDVMNELHDLFSKHKVVILPEVLEHTMTSCPASNNRVQFRSIVKVKYSFVAEDGSHCDTIAIGEGMDMGDKSTSKALSIALKYALLQTFLIPTEEKKDPDADTPEPTDRLALALHEVEQTENITALTLIWNHYPDLHQKPEFTTACTNRKQFLQS